MSLYCLWWVDLRILDLDQDEPLHAEPAVRVAAARPAAEALTLALGGDPGDVDAGGPDEPCRSPAVHQNPSAATRESPENHGSKYVFIPKVQSTEKAISILRFKIGFIPKVQSTKEKTISISLALKQIVDSPIRQ